ncbi:MAG: ribose ABC transporter permease [Chloroflexota bacterium]
MQAQTTATTNRTFAWKAFFQQYGLMMSLILLCVGLALASDRFLTVDNLTNVLRQASINGIISIGMMLVIMTRGIDLSVGSVLALATIVGADLFLQYELAPIVAILIVLAVGGLAGAVNGVLVSRVNIPPFIATLGMMTLARGAALAYSEGQPITGLGELGEGIRWLGSGVLFGVPVPIYVMAVVYVLTYILLNHTSTGRYIQGIGDNERAAFLSGLPVRQIQVFVYSIAGLLAALGGIILMGRLNSAQPTAGEMFEFDAIAAVVVGGTSFEGGQGTVIGTLIGVLIIAILDNGLNLLDVSAFYQDIVKGVVIALALLIYRVLR